MISRRVVSLLLLSLSLSSAWLSPLSNRPLQTYSKTSMLLAQGPGGGRQTKKQIDSMIEFINEPVKKGQSVDQSKVPQGGVENDPLAHFVRSIAKAADMRKAEGIVAMRISKVSTVASFIVICTGNSRPQNQAIAKAIEDDVKEEFGGEWVLQGNGVPEGNADSGWILLDYGDVMVHIMTPKSRLYYDIEGQWREKGAEYLDLSNILLPNSIAQQEAQEQMKGTMEGISEEEDPFWS